MLPMYARPRGKNDNDTPKEINHAGIPNIGANQNFHENNDGPKTASLNCLKIHMMWIKMMTPTQMLSVFHLKMTKVTIINALLNTSTLNV